MPLWLRPARGARPLDRRRQLSLAAGAVAAACALAFASIDSAARAQPPVAPRLLLQDQAWLAPKPDLARTLTAAPRECLARSSPDIEAGRALFAAPTVLGGPAARAGLSCAACHASGRTQPAFLLPELTDRPGAADVTSEWASKVRGDGRMNPVPIPDLAGAHARPAYGMAQTPSLRAFIRSVVVDEFQGADAPVVIDALTAYVAALDAPCSDAPAPLTLDAAITDVDRAITAAAAADDPRLAGAMLLAARHLIGRLVERTPERAPFAASRADLARLAVDLGAARAPDGSATPAAVAAAAPAWRARLAAAVAPLRRRAAETYFDETTLRRALAKAQK